MKPAWVFLLPGVAALGAAPILGAQRPWSPAVPHQQLLQFQCALACCSVSPDPAARNAVVLLPGGARPVDFAWLRGVPAKAPKSKTAAAQLKPATGRPGEKRSPFSPDLSPALRAGPVASATVRQEQALLRGILRDGDFPKAQPPGLLRRVWNGFLQWLSSRLQRMTGKGSGQRWFVPALLLGLLALACGGLVWWFSRVTRSRGLSVPLERMSPAAQGRPDQDWEVWLEQARGLAAQRQWRESIHRVYWAAIAQLEARGAWRADKARTPREYLTLIEAQNSRRGDLLALTRCMEGVWYGGRPASEQDYVRACALFDRVTAR